MKKIVCILTVIAMLTMTACLCSCSSNSDFSASETESVDITKEIDEKLQGGSWATISESITLSFAFDNGKCHLKMFKNGSLYDSRTTEYTIKDDGAIYFNDKDEKAFTYTYEDEYLKLYIDDIELYHVSEK